MRTGFLLLVFSTLNSTPDNPAISHECRTTPLVTAWAPLDPNAGAVGPANWYVNEDRTIWVGPVPAQGWRTNGSVYVEKTYWVRPKGTQLAILGQRLDLSAPPLEVQIPCCYTSGFQIVGLNFPTPGCWRVTAVAGQHKLRFVTVVGVVDP